MKYANLPADKNIGTYEWNHQAHLGSGAFGDVYLGRDTKNNNQLVAIKVMKNSKLQNAYLQQTLKNEVEILSKLKGPNVLGLYDFLQTQEENYIIQMFCNNGDFRSYLTKKQTISENEAKVIFIIFEQLNNKLILADLIKGLQELSINNLVHRDLKPENILIHDKIFKVADFGFGRTYQQNQMLQSMVGTPLYMSPQILQQMPYTSKSDIWSLGLIYYEMLYGTTPWPCNNQQELVYKILSQPIKLPYSPQISKESQSFIIGALQVEEKDRLSWEQIFSHPVILQSNVEQNIPNKPSESSTHPQLSKKCIEIIGNIQLFLQEKNLEINTVFSKLDSSADGQLDIQEFTRFLQFIRPDLSPQDINEIFTHFADKNTQTVNYQKFEQLLTQFTFNQEPQSNGLLVLQRADQLIKKLIDKIIDNNINIERLFKNIDLSGDNKIDLPELTALLLKIDDDLTPEEAKYIFEKFDKGKKGLLTFDEFRNAIYGDVEKKGGDPYEKIDYGNVPSQVPPQVQETVKLLKKIIAMHHLDIKTIFQNFDFDQSQSLNFEEFSSFLRVVNAQLTKEDLQIIFQAFDQNHNNLIELTDIQTMLSS